MHLWKRGKAAAPYVVGGTKISLDVLSKITTLINPPCVGAVISAASQIITIVEGVRANRDDAKTLVERLLALLVVISDSCQQKNHEDLASDIRTSVQRLGSQLDAILAEIEEMRAATDPRTVGGFLKGGLLYSENCQKIKGFTTRIDWAMDAFQVEGRIQDAIRLRDIHGDVRDIRGILENMAIGPKAQDTVLLSSSVLPFQPTKLYGRGEELNDITGRITSTASPRLAILGPGGIGKTALLLAVMEQADIKQKFGESRLFVRCEEATSVALLVELIARSLNIEASSSDRMEGVRTRLRSTNHPVLLLLDNFETPWDIPEGKTQVEEILCSLASFSHVATLITMRSNVPPSTHVPWSLPWLQPLSVLSKEAARDLYVSIDANAINDGSLDVLLAELSYMPLAITLMASLGRSGETPTALLEAWKDKVIGTDLLHGTDKSQSVSISIRLSIESNLMRSVPEALMLLSVIAMLPAGADATLLPTLVPSIRNLVLAKATLRGVALTNLEADAKSLQLLSPIRAYVLKNHPLSADLKEALYNAYIGLVSKHDSTLGDSAFTNDAKALGKEETNLEVILPDAIQSGTNAALGAAITFCRYQLGTRPRLEVIQAVVHFCREKRKAVHLACSLYYFGRLLEYFCQYGAAQAAYHEGVQTYTELGDRPGVASCLRGMGDIHRAQSRHDEAKAVLQEAERMYTELDDRLGTANCLLSLASVHRIQSRYEEARAALQEAGRMYLERGDRVGAANCLRSIGDVHRIQGRYEESQEALKAADKMYRGLGDWVGVANCLWGIGDVYRIQARYSEAQSTLEEAGRMFTELGHRLGATNCLLGIGDIHRIQGRYEEGLMALQEADRMYTEWGDWLGVANCLRRIGDIHRIQGRYEQAETALKEADRIFTKLGNQLCAANCLLGIGDIRWAQGRYAEALESYEEVYRIHIGLNERLGLAHCLLRMGEVFRIQGNYDEAREKLEKARVGYEKLGRGFEAYVVRCSEVLKSMS